MKNFRFEFTNINSYYKLNRNKTIMKFKSFYVLKFNGINLGLYLIDYKNFVLLSVVDILIFSLCFHQQ